MKTVPFKPRPHGHIAHKYEKMDLLEQIDLLISYRWKDLGASESYEE